MAVPRNSLFSHISEFRCYSFLRSVEINACSPVPSPADIDSSMAAYIATLVGSLRKLTKVENIVYTWEHSLFPHYIAAVDDGFVNKCKGNEGKALCRPVVDWPRLTLLSILESHVVSCRNTAAFPYPTNCRFCFLDHLVFINPYKLSLTE